MEIYKRIFVIFAILIVQRACKETSEEYEETKLEPAEERFVLDDNSTIPESAYSDSKYNTMGKRSIEMERGTKDTTKNDVDTSKPEYFKKTNMKTTNPPHSEPNLLTDESQPWEERSDFEIETETFLNRKHQSRGLKDYKYKTTDGEGKNSHSEREVDSLNDEKEKPVVNLNLNIGWNKEAEAKKTFKPQEDFFILEHLTVFKDGEDEPYKKVDVKKYFAALRDMGIEHTHLIPGNMEFIERIHEIHTNFLDLIEKDIKSNIFPFLFYHTVAPVIKEKILPHLAKPNVIKVVQELAKNYQIIKLLNILLDLTDLPKFKTNNANIIIRKLNDHFASSKVVNNENNRKLVRKYEKNLNDLLEIIDHDWEEYEAPVSFINYVLIYSKEEPFIRRTQMLFKRIKYQKEKTVLPRYKGEFSKDEDSESWMKWIQWVRNIIGFGRSEQEL